MTFRLDWPTPAEILQREPSISKFFPHFSKLFISEQRLQSRPVVKQTITFLSRLRRGGGRGGGDRDKSNHSIIMEADDGQRTNRSNPNSWS